MSKENLLSTKQFATLCQTTKHTLIHYDEIGILKPNYVGENAYRYYSLSQTEIFDVISFLKEMGLSLKEIKAYLENRDIDKLLELFQVCESELELERKRLEKRKKIESRKSIKKETTKTNFAYSLRFKRVRFYYAGNRK